MTDAPDAAHVAAQFDERARHYDDSPFHRALAARAVAFAGLDGVGSVLDVATGTGLVLRALPADRSRRIVGVDLSDGMLQVARQHLPTAELLRADATATLPFPDGSFDLITCVTALHLMADPAGALRAWRALLAPGGRVVIAAFFTGDLDGLPGVDAALSAGAVRRPHSSNAHLHERTGTLERLADMAESAGLRPARHETWVYPDRRVEATKTVPTMVATAAAPDASPDALEVCLLAEFGPQG